MKNKGNLEGATISTGIPQTSQRPKTISNRNNSNFLITPKLQTLMNNYQGFLSSSSGIFSKFDSMAVLSKPGVKEKLDTRIYSSKSSPKGMNGNNAVSCYIYIHI